MIESKVQVTAIEPGFVWVIADQAVSGCNSCSASGSCGGGLLTKLKSRGDLTALRATVATGLEPRVGDYGILGIEESTYLWGMLRVYILPLLVMISFAIVVDLMTSNELITVISGVLGLVTGLLLTRFSHLGLRPQYQTLPTLLKILPGQSVSVDTIKLAL